MAQIQSGSTIGQFMKRAETRQWSVFACLTILVLALTSNIESSAERAFAAPDDYIPVDFPVFYLGGKIALQRSATPLYYPPADRRQGYTLLYKYAEDATPWAQMGRAIGIPRILQFTNPPFSAVLMAPLALLPWQWAYLIWQIVSVILTVTSVFLALKLLPSGVEFAMFVLMFAGACFFYPFRNTLAFGQANAPMLFAWSLGVYLFKRRRPTASAFCFALGTVLKISPVIAVPLLALRRQWRWLAAYVGGVAACTGASVWALGWKTNVTWLTLVYPGISSGVGNFCNRSLAGLLDALCGPQYTANFFSTTEWPVPEGLSFIEKACGLTIALGYILWCWRKRRDAKGLIDELVLLPLVYLLAAPFSWQHHFLMALLPITYLWAKGREAAAAERWALFLSTLVLGTELPMYIAGYSPVGGPYLIIVAIALWPAATCALLWVGMRMYSRSQVDSGSCRTLPFSDGIPELPAN